MPTPSASPDPRLARAHSIVRALRKSRSRLARKVEAIRGDLAEAERAPEYRRQAEALLAYLHEVPKRASRVKLADPHDANATLDIVLDPALSAQGNAARYFKRAAKGDRGAVEIRARIEAAEAELAELSDLIERAKMLEQRGIDPADRAGIERDLELAAKKLPIALRSELQPLTPRVPVEPPPTTSTVKPAAVTRSMARRRRMADASRAARRAAGSARPATWPS